MVLLISGISNVNCTLVESNTPESARESLQVTRCKIQTSSNFVSNVKEIFDKDSDLVYLKWKFHVEDPELQDEIGRLYLQRNADIIDPFTWVLARSKNGHRLLTFPFDFGMLSLGTLELGISKPSAFQIVIPEDQIDCFRNTSEAERLSILAEFFLSATAEIVRVSDNEYPTSICLERFSKRSISAAQVYIGTHVMLQMSSYYSCWYKNQSTSNLNQFNIEPQTGWLNSILDFQPTWYLCLFIAWDMAWSILFVFRCKRIAKRIKKSDSNLNTFIRCARFVSLAYLLLTTVSVFTHYENYCKRRDIANTFSTMTRASDILHLFIGVAIIKLPELYRISRRMFSRKTLLAGFFFISVFISTCINCLCIAEVIYFTTAGLLMNPKSILLIVLQTIRCVLFIRALFDLHNFLRFDKSDKTIMSFLLHRAIHPEFCCLYFLSLLHTVLDPYNVSPVTACMLAAAFINGIWYKLDYFRKWILIGK